MTRRSTLLHSLLLVVLTGLLAGCGGSAGTAAAPAVQSGKLAQGPVSGAVVFADRIVGTRGNFVWDTDEIKDVTDADGNYKLPSVPNYDYVLVSKGGTDTLTGLPAIQLLAQPGSINITILTTLLTLDSSKTTKLSEKLQALQPVKAPLDFDVSKDATPATLLLVKSVEIAVQSITDTVISKAVKAGYTITDQQIADVQFRALEQIALGFAGTTENLATPAGLRNALEAALAEGIKKINADAAANKSNLVIDLTAAPSIADNAVDAAATVLGTTLTSTVPLSASTVQSEIDLANASAGTFAATFAKALDALVNPTMAKISSLITTSASTPSPYGPANIFIVFVNTIPGTITGSAGTGGSGGGTGGGF
ncbi:MAG: hypothetical protein IPQ16_07550 [Geobacteraceae bacterium]|nr:hypothetical protein [Geobacteraceae bacterium]